METCSSSRYLLLDFIDGFVTGLPISMDWNGTSHDSNGIACSTNWKSTNYNWIIAIVDGLMKMVHYKPMQITRDALGLAEVFMDLIVRHGPPRPPRLDCTSRLSRYLKVLVIFLLLPGRQANYDSILVVVDRLRKMLRNEPVQITIDAPALAVGYTPFGLDCSYQLRIFYKNIN